MRSLSAWSLAAAFALLVGARAGAADPDLVVWWKLDDGTGSTTAADSSDNEMDGALTGGPVWQPTGGQVDGALYFDGVDDKISAPLTWTPTAFTVAFWINPQSLWDWSPDIGGPYWGTFEFHGAADGQVYVGVDGATRFTLPSGTIVAGVWQHFAFTFDNGEASLYKGGVPLASRSGMTMPVAWTCFETHAIRGSLDDVRIYGRALSPAEVAILYDTQHNEPPAVSVTSPTEGQTFSPGSDIAISADASDSDGTIAVVEFFYGGTTKIGEDTTSPYSATWTGVPAGGYALTAKATDNEGGVGTSAAVYVEVGAAVTIAKAQDAAEPSTNGSFTVTRSGDTSGAINVGFEVDLSSTATAGADFTLSPASQVSFADGETTKTITVEVADDCAGEGLERVVVGILPGEGYGPGSPASATVKLADDEVDPELALWWRLDETSGATAADSSGNGMDGVLTGGPVWQPTGGQVDGALWFDGGDDRICAPLTWTPTVFSVAFWINPQSIWDWVPEIGGPHWGTFDFHGAADGRVYVGTDAGTRFVLDAGTIVTSAWQHFAFTFDNGEARLYKGGVLIASKSGMTMPVAWTRFETHAIRGSLDDVRVYGRVLSPEDVWALGRAVAFERAASSGDESLSPAELVVTLAQASTQPVTVDYSAAGVTAEPEDFSLPAGTLTFAPGETSKTIALAVVADVDAADETVEVTLSNPAGATLGATATHVYTIHEFGIVSREVLDTDGDHRTERVRVVAGRTLNDDFTGLAATVAGRVVLGFETGAAANDTDFMIILREDEPDTGAPDVAIVSNSSLKDAATGCLVMAADTGAVTPLDAVPPVVASTLPEDGDAAVWGAGAIRVTFSEEMDRVSAEAAFSTDPVASGSFAWAGASMIFAPDAPLPDLTLYTVSVAATAKDLQGNELAAAHSFSFTTGEGLGVNIPLESAVSPAFVEGWCAPAEDLTVTASSDGDAVPVTLLGPGRFYVNAPLREDGEPTGVVVTRSATGEPDLTATGAVTWTATDITGKSWSTDTVVIRKGDSLLLTASNGNKIDADGNGTFERSGGLGAEYAVTYDAPGEVIVTAKLGSNVVGSLTVIVIEVAPISPVACQVGYRREKDIEMILPEHADKVHFSAAEPALLEVSVKEYTATGATLFLEALARGTPVLTARIGDATGPIITTKEIDEFTLDVPARCCVIVNDDTDVGASKLTIRPYIPNLDFEFDMFTSQSTFLGGATFFTINTSDVESSLGEPGFEPLWDETTGETVGEFLFTLEVPDTEPTWACCMDITAIQWNPKPVAIGKEEGVNGYTCKVFVDVLHLCPNGDTGELQIQVTEAGGNRPHPIVIEKIPNKIGPIFTASGTRKAKPPLTCTLGLHRRTVKSRSSTGKYDVTVGTTPFDDRIQVVTTRIALNLKYHETVTPHAEYSNDWRHRFVTNVKTENLGVIPDPFVGNRNLEGFFNHVEFQGRVCTGPIGDVKFRQEATQRVYVYIPGMGISPPTDYPKPSPGEDPLENICDTSPSPTQHMIYSGDAPGLGLGQLGDQPRGTVQIMFHRAKTWIEDSEGNAMSNALLWEADFTIIKTGQPNTNTWVRGVNGRNIIHQGWDNPVVNEDWAKNITFPAGQ